MIQKKILLVLDWSNLMFRSLYMTQLFGQNINYNNQEDINSFIAKFTTDVLYLLKTFSPNNVILATDSIHAWRKDILNGDNGYKSNRKKDEYYNWDNIFKASDDLLNIFKSKGITVAKCNHAEADDMTAICKEIIFDNYKDWNIIIVSADADISQLIDFNPETNQYCLVYNTIANKNKKRNLYVTQDFLKWYNQPTINNIFFSNTDYSKEYISRLLINNSTIQLVEKDPDDVVLNKIFCGDDGDCVPSFYDWYKNGKKVRVTNSKYKKIKEDLDINNTDDLVTKCFLLNEELNSVLKTNVEINCEDRLKRQRILVELKSELFPKEIQDYKEYLNKNIENHLDLKYPELRTNTFLIGTKFESILNKQKVKEAEIFKNLDKYIDKTNKLF